MAHLRAPAAGATIQLVDLPLLERDHEIEALEDAVAATARGDGGVVLIEAPAGSGKTRLLHYARKAAQAASVRVLAARGSELEAVYPFGVVRQLFDPVASPAEAEALFTDAAAPAAQVLGGAPAHEGVMDLLGAVHALYWLTVRVADAGPMLVSVDDAHWADRPSLRFLFHLSRRVEGLALLVLVAARSSELADEAEEWRALAGDPAAVMLRPAPLSELAGSELVRLALGDDAANSFCAACWRATGGNPLFLRELLAALRQAGVTPTADAAEKVASVGPPAVARFVLHRLHRLGPAAAALAEALAVAGDVDVQLAAQIAGVAAESVPRVVEQLADADIVHGVTRLEFVHPVTRAAVYESLPAGRRARLHAATADALIQAGAPPEQPGGHLLHVPPAGDPRRAVALRGAAAVARSRGDPATAATYLRRLLDEPPPASELSAVRLETARAEQWSNQFGSAEARLRALVEDESDPAFRVEAAEWLARAGIASGRASAVIEPLRELVEQLTDAGDPRALAAQKAMLLIARGNPSLRPLALEWLPRFARAAEGEPLYAAVAAAHSSHEAVGAGHPSQEAREAARAALKSGQLPPGEPAAYIAIATLRLSEDFETLDPRLELSLELARAAGNSVLAALTLAERGLLALARGSLAAAQTDAEAGFELIRPGHFAVPMLASALIETAIERSDLDAADRVASDHEAAGQGLFSDIYLASLARLRLAQERFEEALVDSLLVGERHAQMGWERLVAPSWRRPAALASLALGDRERARSLALEQLAHARAFGAPIALGQALRVAGRVIGDSEGLRLCEESVAVLEQTPARLELAHSLHVLGASYIRMRHRREAREPLRRAITFAKECGAERVARAAEADLRSGGGRAPRFEETGLAALTPAERRVAELAAVEKTNREIAQTLFVTEKTVELHLTSVYRKLGIRSRWQLSDALVERQPA